MDILYANNTVYLHYTHVVLWLKGLLLLPRINHIKSTGPYIARMSLVALF